MANVTPVEQVVSKLDSSNLDRRFTRLLELLTVGSGLVRASAKGDQARVSFFALKDRGMALLHRVFANTGALSFHFVPYLRRCAACKRKAAALFAADPSRTWEYHLNLLPACAADTEEFDRSTVSMTIRLENRKFNLHAPAKEALKWNLAVDEIDRRPWVPEEDFPVEDAPSGMSLENIIDDLRPLLQQLENANNSQDRSPSTVFISAASSDYGLAQNLLNFLTTNNISPFLAPLSLPEKGDANYLKAIDEAIDSADHMVVVISSAQNANSPWVRHEWELFLNEKLAGRKRGNLLTAASETCEHARLPIALRSGEIVPLTDNGLKKLLRYLT